MKQVSTIALLLGSVACELPTKSDLGAAVVHETDDTGTVDPDPGPDCESPATYYFDADGDGYGDALLVAVACEAPVGHVLESGDCDDMNASVSPAAIETCNGADDDCDLEIDEGLERSFYLDADSDGFGQTDSAVEACESPDSELYVEVAGDCDDSAGGVHPEAAEICDGLDQDCDGVIDNGLDEVDWFQDTDRDGHGDPATGVTSCSKPGEDWVRLDDDCNDSDAEVSPTATETCNGLDDDCDLEIDEDLEVSGWYIDADADGFGDAATEILSCTAVEGRISDGSDCDDTDTDVHPGAVESCNGADDDCDLEIDEGLELSLWHADLDGDGYGDPEDFEPSCTELVGRVLNSLDCDDTSATVHPGAAEICNDIDDNCDGEFDEGLELLSWFADDDGDGYGTGRTPTMDCGPLAGFVDTSGDCDDTDDTIYPGADEYIDETDRDCSDVNDDLMTHDAHTVIQGEVERSGFGYSLSAGSDVNDDGFSDLLVGSQNGGYVALFSGDIDPGYHDTSDAILTIAKPELAGGFGRSITLLEDIDGDGSTDMAVGAPDAASDLGGTGQIYIYLGPLDGSAASLVSDLTINALVGANLGDVLTNAGGFGDDDGMLATSGHTKTTGEEGVTILDFSVLDGTLTSSTMIELSGPAGDVEFGHAIASGRDFNGDGLDDLVVGAPSAECALDGTIPGVRGAIYVFMSPLYLSMDYSDADALICGDYTGDNFGAALANVDDWEGDGYGDVVVGAPQYGESVGRAYVIGGVDLGTSVDSAVGAATVSLAGTSGLLGSTVASDGDFDGDGLSEVIVGAPAHAVSETVSGAAFMYWGEVITGVVYPSVNPGVSMEPESSATRLGEAVAGLANLSTGMLESVVVGGPGADIDGGGDPEIETGSVWFFSD